MNNESEIKSSVIRTLLNSVQIPVLSPILNEFFDFRSKLKQNRLNQFIELLENFFSNHRGVNLENFQTAEFSDLFESVLKRVVQTQSIEKYKRFKNILVNQLNQPIQNIDDSEIYLDLISSLSEIEIKLLYEYNEFLKSQKPKVEARKFQIDKLNILRTQLSSMPKENEKGKSFLDLQTEISDIEADVAKIQKDINFTTYIHTHDYFGISKDQFLFYKQRLFSRALLVDIGHLTGSRPFTRMEITQFGIQFVNYIIIA